MGSLVSLIGGMIGEGLEHGVKAFMKASKDEQKAMVTKIADSFHESLNNIILKTGSIRTSELRELLNNVLNELRAAIDDIKKTAEVDPVEAFFKILFFPIYLLYELSSIIWGSFYNFLRDLFEPEEPPTFEQAVRNAEKFLTLAGDFNVLATIFNIIGDIKILGSKLPGKAIGRFITNISWTFGIGWLTWVVMGPVLRWSIADPYEAEMRRRLRPKEFTKSEIEDLYEWGLKRLEELYNYYVELGYSDDKIEQLLEILKKKIFSSEVRKYITTLETNYADGYVSDQELAEALSLGYWTDLERQFLFWRAKQRRINKINDLRVKEIERAFLNRRIDEDEATARLTEFIKDPAFVEALIAYWKQRLKPEEEIEPAERLIARKKRLEIRIKGLNDQITYLQEYLRERMELYDAMIHELEQRYTARMQRVEEIYDARIAAIQEEFSNYRDKKMEEIEARIGNLIAELSRFIQIYLPEFRRSLERISDETLGLAGLSRGPILNAYVNGQFDQLLDMLTTLSVYATEKELSAVKSMMRIVDRYYDLVSRIEMLRTISTVRIELRESRVAAIINKLKSEKFARINQLKSELESRKEILMRKKRIEEIRTNMRISRLHSKVDELSVELSSIERRIGG